MTGPELERVMTKLHETIQTTLPIEEAFASASYTAPRVCEGVPSAGAVRKS